jgi:hypothetical protein
MATPSASSVPANTITARKPQVEITPDGGSAANYVVRKITGGPKKDHIDRMGISSDGLILQVDRRVPKSRNDAFTVELDEFPSALIALLTGNTNKCTARLFVGDPDDAANTPAFSVTKSGGVLAFAALAYIDGEFSFEMEADKPSTYTFKILPTEAVVYNIATSV